MREMKYLETLCESGHIEQVRPVGIVAAEAIFDSAADYCQRAGCERPIVEWAPVYENDDVLLLELLSQDMNEDKA